MERNGTYDVVIIGAGFSGTLTALCLHQKGLNVCVLEKDEHPRFAVGESSTPIADMILRTISDTYDLPWLKPFSRYGSWQKYYPEITCGLKRGFSYYKHKPNSNFTTDKSHSNELLAATNCRTPTGIALNSTPSLSTSCRIMKYPTMTEPKLFP